MESDCCARDVLQLPIVNRSARLLRDPSDQMKSLVHTEYPKIPSRHFSNITTACLFVWRTRKRYFPSMSVFYGPIIKSVFIHKLTGQGHIGPLAKKRQGCHFFGARSTQCHPSFPKCMNILIDEGLPGLPGPPEPAFSGAPLYLNLRGRPKTSRYASAP